MLKIEKFWRSEDGRLFTAMHTLLYPSVLGSLMYALPDNIVKGTHYGPEAVWLATMFFLAFSLDYIHSARETTRPFYTPILFALDLIIVVLLFCAGQRILGTILLPWASVPAMLALAKFAASLWEVAADTDEDSARNSDFLLAVVYLGLAVLIYISGDKCWLRGISTPQSCWPGWSWILGLALLIDALSFVYYKSLAHVTGRKSSA